MPIKELLARWLLLTIAIVFAAKVTDGIYVSGLASALAAAAMLGILNTFLKPVLLLLTLPITVLTLGLFMLVLNALMLAMASFFVPGFYVFGFGAAVWGSIVISLINWVFSALVKPVSR